MKLSSTNRNLVEKPKELETQRKTANVNTREQEVDTNKKHTDLTAILEGDLCLDVFKKARQLEKPQHKCRQAFCDQPVSQICHCNIEDPDSNNPVHRIHKSMKSCKITQEIQQKVSTNKDPLMCTECYRTAKTSAALE